MAQIISGFLLKEHGQASFILRVFSLLAIILRHTTSAYSIPQTPSPPTLLPQTPVHELYGFQPGTWLENLVVRPNGSILTTEMTQPRLWQFEPLSSAGHAGQEPVLVHEFPGYLGLLGIVETKKDVFALTSGNFSLETVSSTPGSYAVWTVDFSCDDNGKGTRRGGKGRNSCQSKPRVRKVADVEEAHFLNGIAYPGDKENAVVLADSDLGVVFRLDLDSGEWRVIVDDPLMKKCSPEVLEGINGLKVYGDTMYFTRGFCSVLAKVPINPDGSARGLATVVGTAPNSTWTFDDFVVDVQGNAYQAVGYNNLIARIAPDGEMSVIAGSLNSTLVAEPTATAFGRTEIDMERKRLYVTTGGAVGDPINGSIVVGGQLLAIDLP